MIRRLKSSHVTGAIVLAALALTYLAQIGDPIPTSRAAPAAQSPPADAPAGWKLAWSDEFDGKEVDPAKWNFDHGSFLQAGSEWLPGWGNGELEFYTKRPQNVSVQDGMLHIRALREHFKGSEFTSARLTTRKLFAKRYGRFDIRAKLPTGRGIWPAIWMRPQDDAYGGWAASGEIDVMEARGQEPQKVLGTLHYGSRWPANVHSGRNTFFRTREPSPSFTSTPWSGSRA